MASTYSNLKIQLMATGENSGTWGNVTNVNLGTAIEEAIAGSADVTFASNNVSVTLTDTNATQTARNMRLNLTGTTGGSTRALTVPDIEKLYVVNNGCADAVEVKNSTGANVSVPAGKTMWVFSTGAGVVDVVTHLTSLTLGSPLPVASGGTGSNTGLNLATSATGILPIANGGTGTNTGPNLSSNVNGILSVANGGTGVNTITGIIKGAGTSAFAAATAGTDYVRPNTTSNLTAGFTATTYDAGTQTTGTFTPDPINGNFQKAVNGGVFTLAPPSSDCTMIIKITNNASAGAVNTASFTKVTGTFTNTNTHAFFCYITKCDSSSDLTIKALQ